jgi:hypothetical protein
VRMEPDEKMALAIPGIFVAGENGL